ncbi:Lrp/AsnC family transcriptional regulator, leucine-responsive regulatory protein [Formivibrio citricus]|uniref:Lrp/AsnC family transcriptional regulator, leucine-responsive regulatory protein n=1 Tax=Formivibrio citricus TaxID=83765 RepID=A0A1I4XSI4_9NEIS|nr:winged helix-turn-helix transcriptional regulator [Formivibrio citricus]SFN28373.1 Lrp/AsnC family transcriptional regulator, leucine-responsive regulatory protein [Formivibrio citricus]
MHELDKIDRKILAILQREARIPITELAARVGLSPTPVSERVKRLEQERVITGYHAHLNQQLLGLRILVFVELRLSKKSAEIFDAVKRELALVPEVLECHLVAGEFDYLIKARIPDMQNYRGLLGRILLKLPMAIESRSYVVMEEVKESHIVEV